MHSEAKQANQQNLEHRKLYCKGQARRMGGSCSKDLNLPGVLGNSFIGKIWGEGCRVRDFLLIGLWWGNKGDVSGISTFWFQPVWGLHACGQHEVTILHLVGVLVSTEQLKDMHEIVIYPPSGGTSSPVTLLSY